MPPLGVMATAKKHVNVLQHLLGFFKDRLGAGEKRELLGLIEDYARGLVPLIVPITLVNHYVTGSTSPTSATRSISGRTRRS